MADPRVTLLDLLAKCDQGADPTFLRDGLKLISVWFLVLLAGATVSQLIARVARQDGPRG